MKQRLFVITILATSPDVAEHIAKSLATDIGNGIATGKSGASQHYRSSQTVFGYGEAVEKPVNWWRRYWLRSLGWFNY